MLRALIDVCERAVNTAEGHYTVETVSRILDAVAPELDALEVTHPELPWGRYLLHHHPADLFNLQLDVFSSGYSGGIHSHGVWGAFWVLQGGLRFWDYTMEGDEARLERHGYIPAGGGQCFCPPTSDWHRVGTRPIGPQTVSVHMYGRGFDLDRGIALDTDGRPRFYPRSPFQDLTRVLPHLRRRG